MSIRHSCFLICIILLGCTGSSNIVDTGTDDREEMISTNPLPPSAAQDEPTEEISPALSVERIQNATWLVLAEGRDGVFTATAFAVGGNLLATNAHVAESLLQIAGRPGGSTVIVQHESDFPVDIRRVWIHPEYDPTSIIPTPDVALIEIEEPLDEFLTIAPREDLESLVVFDQVSLCGFPGSIVAGIDTPGLLTEGNFRPRATCLTGTISALRPFSPAEIATPSNTYLIQYDLPIVRGTSGSAVVNAVGDVIGVNALTFSADGSGGDFNFGIRADKLLELIDGVERGAISGADITETISSDPCLFITCDAGFECDSGFCVFFPHRNCNTTYYNSTWSIGFDVPAIFVETDPNGSLSAIATFGLRSAFSTVSQFSEISVERPFEVGLFSSVDEVVELWIELRSEDVELLSRDSFLTRNGVRANSLVWRSLSDLSDPFFDIYLFEAWVLGREGTYRLTCKAFNDDASFLVDVYESVVRSLCVD